MPERRLIDKDQALTFRSDNGGTYQLKVTNEGSLYFDEVTGAPGTEAVAMWKASSYDGTSQFLKDLSGNGHHLKFGSAHPAYVTNGYLILPGQSGNYASTPDSAAASITGDIDIRAKIAANDWTPSPAQIVLSKWASGAYSYSLELVNITGLVRLGYSLDGTTNLMADSTVAPTATDGSPLWLRATRSAASGNVAFYTSADGSTWAQLGTTVSGTAGNLADTTTPLWIGATGFGNNFSGKVYWAEIRNGIDGPVATKFDPSSQVDLTTGWTASTGETWTINSAASTDGSDPLYLPFDSTQYLYLPGVTGNFASVPDSGPLSITGDLDLRIRLALADWTPLISMNLMSHWSDSGQKGFLFDIRSGADTGKLRLVLTSDGTTTSAVTCSTATGFADGSLKWVRVTWRKSDGLVTFYSSNDGSSWATMGTGGNIIAGGMIFDSNQVVGIGGRGDGAEPCEGKFYRAQMFASVDGSNKVLDIDFGDTSATSISGTKYTLTSGMISATGGISIANAGFMVNGTTGQQGWHTDTSTAGATVVFDIGTTVAMRKVQLFSPGSHPGVFLVDYSDDGTNWTNVPNTSVGPLIAGFNPCTWENVGSHRYWRLRIKAATGGAPWLDDVEWFEDTGINDSPRASSGTFTTKAGQTVSINRTTTGRKSAIVDRSLFLFGADDYMEAVDNSQLDFELADSSTVALVLRHHHPNSNEAWLEKESTAGGATAGWALRGNGSNLTYRLGDGTNQSAATHGLPTASSVSVIVGRRNTATDKLQIIRDGVLGSELTDTLTASAANNLPLRIGAFSNGAPYMNAEFIGAAIWRRALTDAEIAYLPGEFDTD